MKFTYKNFLAVWRSFLLLLISVTVFAVVPAYPTFDVDWIFKNTYENAMAYVAFIMSAMVPVVIFMHRQRYESYKKWCLAGIIASILAIIEGVSLARYFITFTLLDLLHYITNIMVVLPILILGWPFIFILIACLYRYLWKTRFLTLSSSSNNHCS